MQILIEKGQAELTADLNVEEMKDEEEVRVALKFEELEVIYGRKVNSESKVSKEYKKREFKLCSALKTKQMIKEKR